MASTESTRLATYSDILRAELRSLEKSVPIAFGGSVDQGRLQITELFGTRTQGLRNLAVPSSLGLGGRVIARRRPSVVDSYGDCETITHEFDRPVLAEGISSVLAVPVVVGDRPRAVVYAAVRGPLSLGERTLDVVVASAGRITSEFRIRDQVEERLSELRPVGESAIDHTGQRDRVVLQNVQAELRALISAVSDRPLQSRLRGLEQQLASVGRPDEAGKDAPRLSPRELDVLTHVGIGLSNPEIAERLFLLPETVKSYLRSASSKLGAHSRLEAVVLARRLGLLI